MKKAICLALCCLLMIVCVGCGGPKKVSLDGVRGQKWGTSKDQVLVSEGMPSDEGATSSGIEYIVYKNVKGFDLDYDFRLMYMFEEDELYIVTYTLSGLNPLSYIDAYNAVVDAITKEYGVPKSNEERWDASQKDDYADNKGEALKLGYLSYRADYSLDGTDISISLHIPERARRSGEVFLEIMYARR